MSSAPQSMVFTPGSKVIFVSGGYEGGRERVGIVLGVTLDDHVLLCMLDDENVGTPSHIEGFAVAWLRAEIVEGRLEGSLKQVRYVPSVNPCLPLLAYGQV